MRSTAKVMDAETFLNMINFTSFQIFSQDLQFSVSSCTENESHRYGRFLCKILDQLMKWHGDAHLYEKVSTENWRDHFIQCII